MKNLFILPTNKATRLHSTGDLFISPNFQLSKTINSVVEGRNIYITSDEEIKKGDWYLEHTQVRPNRYSVYKRDYDEEDEPENSKKIVITTDQVLINNGVQAINDDFLEWVVKNPTCEKIGIGIKTLWLNKRFGGTWQPFPDESATETKKDYKVIIPQAETDFSNSLDRTISTISIASSMFGPVVPKEETPEEAAERIFTPKYTNYKVRRQGFIEGVKWSQGLKNK